MYSPWRAGCSSQHLATVAPLLAIPLAGCTQSSSCTASAAAAGVRRSLTDQMHRFMASLTEVVFQAHGKTVLYLPQESVDLEDLEIVKKDKELMQRLESTVIRWTRQIKEVVNQKDNSQDAETATP